MADYTTNIIKKYNYWTAFVHPNQGYLGRCLIWCTRENAQDLSEATIEELSELSEIIIELKPAIERSFNADWMNYSFLGNGDRHLHCHMVPRYEKEKVFYGIEFVDTRWGSNWMEDEKFVTSEDLLQSIKVKIISELLE